MLSIFNFSERNSYGMRKSVIHLLIKPLPNSSFFTVSRFEGTLLDYLMKQLRFSASCNWQYQWDLLAC